MKKGFLTIIGLLSLSTIFFTSCNDELNLIGDFEEAAVVYGILNRADSVHYIKINRTFIGSGEESSLAIAQNPDSSYFDAVDCKIKEFDGNGQLIRTFQLHDTIIENKDQNGVFYAPEQKVYVFYTNSSYNNALTDVTDLNYPLKEEHNYYIEIDVNDGQFQITNEEPIELVKGMTVPSPPPSGWTFSDNQNGNYRTGVINTSIAPSSNVFVVHSEMRFDYEENTIAAPGTYEIKSVTLGMGEFDVNPGDNLSLTMFGETFFQQLSSNIPEDANVERRRPYGVQLTVTAGSEELFNYISVNEPSSSLAQTKPDFTNLTASNNKKVIGVFASRYTYIHYSYQIDPFSSFKRALDINSTRELCTGPYTGPLNFCSQHTGDNGESYKCQ